MSEFGYVVVGVDFSPRSISAVELAVSIAEPSDAQVEMVHVVEMRLSDSDALDFGKTRSELEELLVDEARAGLQALAKHLNYKKLQETVVTGSAANELTVLSEERNADMLVIGDTGAGSSPSPKGVGVTAYRLVERGPRNVLVAKAGHCGKINSVAAAISFVTVADDVLRRAHILASISKADLHVVRVIPDIAELRERMAVLPSDIERRLSDSVGFNKRRLDEFVRRQEIHDVVLKTIILSGSPGPALVDYLREENIDVVVLGTGTSYRIAGYPVGSTTHRVLNQTLSSVCVVRSVNAPA
jgi:nucleotide-binding universal stress UspA family protein